LEFDNIASCNSWQCINSFALWLSSIGTVGVSIIALWVSMKDRFIRMDTTFSVGRISGDSPKIMDKWVYILNFTNIGVRPITVVNYDWRIPFTKKGTKSITFPQLDQSVYHLCTRLPKELTDGKSGDIFHANDFFLKIANPEGFLYPKNKILAWFRIHFFKMYISTSVGKRIKVKIHSGVRERLWKEYCGINA